MLEEVGGGGKGGEKGLSISLWFIVFGSGGKKVVMTLTF